MEKLNSRDFADISALRELMPSDMWSYYCLARDFSAFIHGAQVYRVTLGQARQEELLEYLSNNCDEETLKELFINLSPFSKAQEKKASLTT